MKKSTHTVGDWINAGKVGYGILIATATGDQIAVLYGPATNPCAEANAKLICASPEMLQALLAYAELDLRVANCDNCSDGTFPEICQDCFPFADKARLLMRAAIKKAGCA